MFLLYREDVQILYNAILTLDVAMYNNTRKIIDCMVHPRHSVEDDLGVHLRRRAEV
jgi:hypothetical protein